MASALLSQWGNANLLAHTGSYFIAVNPTPGTGIAGSATPTADSNTEVLAVVYNSNPVGERSIVLDFMRLQVTAAGTAGTAVHINHHIDTGNRYSSGGTTLSAVNPNRGSDVASGAVVNFGAVTAGAAVGKRALGNAVARVVIPVVGDTYLLTFGGNARNQGSLAVAGTAITNVNINFAPVIIAPEQSWVLVLWQPSQSAASSFEVELGWAELYDGG